MALSYWQERVARHGAAAAINLDHPDGSLESVSTAHRDLLLPLLGGLLVGDERTVLDFGCGPGRMTGALAALVGRAIGVDPTPGMLALAPPAAGVEYRPMSGGVVPLASGTVDVAFTCLVLGGLDDAELASASGEIRRVLAPGGLVVLCESVSDGPPVGHWMPRTAAAYAACFAWAGLAPVSRFDDAGDPVAVLAGRSG